MGGKGHRPTQEQHRDLGSLLLLGLYVWNCYKLLLSSRLLYYYIKNCCQLRPAFKDFSLSYFIWGINIKTTTPTYNEQEEFFLAPNLCSVHKQFWNGDQQAWSQWRENGFKLNETNHPWLQCVVIGTS